MDPSIQASFELEQRRSRLLEASEAAHRAQAERVVAANHSLADEASRRAHEGAIARDEIRKLEATVSELVGKLDGVQVEANTLRAELALERHDRLEQEEAVEESLEFVRCRSSLLARKLQQSDKISDGSPERLQHIVAPGRGRDIFGVEGEYGGEDDRGDDDDDDDDEASAAAAAGNEEVSAWPSTAEEMGASEGTVRDALSRSMTLAGLEVPPASAESGRGLEQWIKQCAKSMAEWVGEQQGKQALLELEKVKASAAASECERRCRAEISEERARAERAELRCSELVAALHAAGSELVDRQEGHYLDWRSGRAAQASGLVAAGRFAAGRAAAARSGTELAASRSGTGSWTAHTAGAAAGRFATAGSGDRMYDAVLDRARSASTWERRAVAAETRNLNVADALGKYMVGSQLQLPGMPASCLVAHQQARRY